MVREAPGVMQTLDEEGRISRSKAAVSPGLRSSALAAQHEFVEAAKINVEALATRFVRQRALRAGQPVDSVHETAKYAVVVFGRDQQQRVRIHDLRLQREHRLRNAKEAWILTLEAKYASSEPPTTCMECPYANFYSG